MEPLPDHALRRPSGNRLQAPHARSDAGLAQYVDAPHLAGVAHVGAAAYLEAEALAIGYLHQPHPLAVLVAEEGQCAALDCRRVSILVLEHTSVLPNLLVDQPLDLPHLLVGNLLHVAEVEAQPVRRDQRAGLPHVRSQHLTQRRMQQMSSRVVAGRVLPPHGVDVRVHRVAHDDAALGDLAEVDGHVRHYCLGVVHLDLAVGADDFARVAHLAAALGVEGRLHEHDLNVLAFGNLVDRLIVGEKPDDRR